MLEALSPHVIRLGLPSHTLPPASYTNSFLIHDASVGVLVDPGFYEAESLSAVQDALQTTKTNLLKAVLLTHTHQDHVEGLSLLRTAYPEVPVYVHPNELARLEPAANLTALKGERKLTVGNVLIETHFTPGHSPGHLSFYLPEEALVLAGDLVAGQGSTWVGLPEGDVGEYLTSLDKLRALKLKLLAPAHGEPTAEPYNKLNQARGHRLERLEQVLDALGNDTLSTDDLLKRIYPDIPAELTALAKGSLLALLQHHMQTLKVLHLGEDEKGPYARRR